MPTVMIPVPPLSLQVGGVVIEELFGKIPTTITQVSPQPAIERHKMDVTQSNANEKR